MRKLEACEAKNRRISEAVESGLSKFEFGFGFGFGFAFGAGLVSVKKFVRERSVLDERSSNVGFGFGVGFVLVLEGDDNEGALLLEE